jgi:hypothetical protein
MKRCVNARFERSTGLRVCDFTGLTGLEALGCHHRKESRKILEKKRKEDALKLRTGVRLLPRHIPGITHRITPQFSVRRL